MANEVTISTRFQFKPTTVGQLGFDPALTPVPVSVADQDYSQGIIDVTNTDAEFTPPVNIGTPGFIRLKNLDATNTVRLGPLTLSYFVALKPNEEALFRMDGGSIFHITDAGTAKLEYWLVAD